MLRPTMTATRTRRPKPAPTVAGAFSYVIIASWNVEQCQLPQAVLDKLPKIETHEHDPIEAAERIIAGMPNPPEIQYAGSKAFYSPITDRITLPPRELFTSAEEFYATALHETCHYADFRIMPRSLG